MSKQPLLRVEDLAVFCSADRRWLLRDINFSLNHGETVGLIGASGSGKTTLALAIMGLLPTGLRADGRLTGSGFQTVLGPGGKVTPGVGMIFQDAGSALNPNIKIGGQLLDAVKARRRSETDKKAGRRVRDIVKALLEQAGVEPLATARSYPFQLSTGMKQRVLAALALSGRPRLIIADEPTSSLDYSAKEQILKWLKTYQAETACGLLVISHDWRTLAGYADKLLVMQGGRLIESVPADRVSREPETEYTRGLLSGTLTLKTAAAARAAFKSKTGPAEKVGVDN